MGILADHGIDEKVFYLGKLCNNGHDRFGTGKSLRYRSAFCCVDCRGIKAIGVGMGQAQKPRPLEEGLWSKVQKGGADECWEWQGRIDSLGYGRFARAGKDVKAHRASYIVSRGSIPEGMCICHRCDNRRCVNPSHLFLGTQVDNIADMDRKGRRVKQSGDLNHNAKLTNAEAKRLYEIYASGKYTLEQVGKLFGVTSSGAYAAVRRNRPTP